MLFQKRGYLARFSYAWALARSRVPHGISWANRTSKIIFGKCARTKDNAEGMCCHGGKEAHSCVGSHFKCENAEQ